MAKELFQPEGRSLQTPKMRSGVNMAIEFLLVHFPEQRAVAADDDSVGFTNHLMLLSPNAYRITLDGDGYKPAFHDIELSGTTAVRPMVVVFTSTSVETSVLRQS